MKQLMVSSYIIRTRYSFITAKTHLFEGIAITVAETVAIGLAINTMMERVELKKDDVVKISTDSQYTINYLLEMLEYEGTFKEMYDTLLCYRNLCNRCKVYLHKIDSHMKYRNGNSIADRLARYKLKAYVDGSIKVGE